MVLGNGVEAVIHGALALGSALMAFAVFDFKTPRWITWIGSGSTGLLACIFSLQGVSEVTHHEALTYFAHDPLGANVPGATVLASVKKYLVAGIPSMFGFWGFPSFNNSDVKGGIPYPCPGEAAQWGHAIVAVGYDDNKKIKNTTCNKTTVGALLIRNSWGTAWGDQGYGWMPYDYVTNKLALDFWSLLSDEWLDTGQFHF